MFFLNISSIELIMQLIREQNTTILVDITCFLAFFNAITVISRWYIVRVKKSYLYKRKSDEDFRLFPYELKLYLTDPCKMQMIKFTQSYR